MSRSFPDVVIDARPRGPQGPLASELVLGRPVLAHLVELAGALGAGSVAVHARVDDHARYRGLVDPDQRVSVVFATGPPPEGSAVLRTDRLYDEARLRKALRRGRDPESAVVWRLDRPSSLAGADAELIRRRTYQPLGRFWALGPARQLARRLQPTSVRPNGLTAASGLLMLVGASIVAFADQKGVACWATALVLALALVLDTADGHLARLQGTASDFGRWLDACLDELGDMALHAAIAWAAFVRDAHPGWLLLGMAYAMGKYLFVVSNAAWPTSGGSGAEPGAVASRPGILRRMIHGIGHADVRWHLWIVLAALGRLDAALAAYALYFPARSIAGAWRKMTHHA
ncbi:MAG: CDP-alcohol phosphatidyltransferase family protein [Isosphaeraceae bacterium]